MKMKAVEVLELLKFFFLKIVSNYVSQWEEIELLAFSVHKFQQKIFEATQ